jgi:hypothetical protein
VGLIDEKNEGRKSRVTVPFQAMSANNRFSEGFRGLFIIGERFFVTIRQLQAAEVLSKLQL